LRLYILLFSVATFILTAVGLVVVCVGKPVLIFWLIFAYIIAYPCMFALFVPLLTGDGKLSGRKILLLTFSVIIIALAVTSSFWILITPKWSFSVVTDKTTYAHGENVKITVSLKNLGFITHSFKSRVSDPVVISIEYQYTEDPTVRSQVWYSPFHIDITEFSVGPNESFERNFVWNQTNVYLPEREIELGGYYIEAMIPSADSTMPIGADNLFWSWTSINITST